MPECCCPGCKRDTASSWRLCESCKPRVLEAGQLSAEAGFDPRIPRTAEGCDAGADGAPAGPTGANESAGATGIALGLTAQLVARPFPAGEREVVTALLLAVKQADQG